MWPLRCIGKFIEVSIIGSRAERLLGIELLSFGMRIEIMVASPCSLLLSGVQAASRDRRGNSVVSRSEIKEVMSLVDHDLRCVVFLTRGYADELFEWWRAFKQWPFRVDFTSFCF